MHVINVTIFKRLNPFFLYLIFLKRRLQTANEKNWPFYLTFESIGYWTSREDTWVCADDDDDDGDNTLHAETAYEWIHQLNIAISRNGILSPTAHH